MNQKRIEIPHDDYSGHHYGMDFIRHGDGWRTYTHQEFSCGPSYHLISVPRWMSEAIVPRNQCTGERITWTAPGAPTQRMESTAWMGSFTTPHGQDRRSWAEKSADEILMDMHRFAHREWPEIRLTEYQERIMAAVARGERIAVAGGRRAGWATLHRIVSGAAQEGNDEVS